ncbi:hypothetical protein B9G69_006765 [Bdellovibrio sp. SKB1291214]|uniref:hypothetical protein n=1 Tax=Bdellovibrio sp. SKB1291214 TaxID=1732569 RepID=UPI000B51A475|nr:hypothetical protein [Bdellovibrio sp. SKB1291214]UYL10279.1 hypothetical protein B9G69_006765 [Bdellovibrio sp. SKB1291214]
MQIEMIMKQTTKKKAVSQKETGVSHTESSKIHSAIKIALVKRERERISNLVEREMWSKRLAF